MFFRLSVIPASLWVFILGTEMMTSAVAMVTGRMISRNATALGLAHLTGMTSS